MWPAVLALTASNVDALLAKSGVGRKVVSFKKKQVIFSQGERSDTIFYIVTGIVKLTVAGSSGKEAVVGFLHAGTFLGESCLAPDLPTRQCSAVALSETHLLQIRRDAMIRMLRADEHVSYLLIVYLLEVIARMQEDVVSNLVNSSEKRLARVLLSIAELRKSTGSGAGSFTQQTLAETIGATRQRVNFLMRRFKDRGFIEDSSGTRIHQSLRDLAGNDRPARKKAL